jgi:hypothetical protein
LEVFVICEEDVLARKTDVDVKTLVHFLFRLVWRRRLNGLKLVKVIGWRSCLVDTAYGQRQRTTFVFGKSRSEKDMP